MQCETLDRCTRFSVYSPKRDLREVSMIRLGQLLRVALESAPVAEYWPSYTLSVKDQDGVALLEAEPTLAIDGPEKAL